MTVDEAVDLYIEEVRSGDLRNGILPLAAGTVNYYRGFLQRFTIGLTTLDITTIGPDDWISAWKANVYRPLRPRSQRTYRAVICRWLDWCTEHDHIAGHEFRKVACDRNDAATRPKVSFERFAALLAAAASLETEYERARATALLWTAWACMLRWAEVIALRVHNLRLEGNEPEVLIEYGKGGKSAWLPLDYTAVAALRAWLAQRGDLDHDCLWCNVAPKGSPMKRPAWPRLLTRLGTIAGIDVRECKTHGMRRGSATAMLLAGYPISEVSEFLRHSNIQTTWDYVEAGPLRLKRPNVRNWTSIALQGTPHVAAVPNLHGEQHGDNNNAAFTALAQTNKDLRDWIDRILSERTNLQPPKKSPDKEPGLQRFRD